MLNKLKNLFKEQPSLEKVTLIVRPHEDSITLSVLPSVKAVESKPGLKNPDLKIESFVIKGSDEDLENALKGGFLDLIASDIALSQELQSAEERKKKAIEAANKAEQEAKKKAKDAKSEDSKKLLAEIESLKKELEEAKADKQVTLL